MISRIFSSERYLVYLSYLLGIVLFGLMAHHVYDFFSDIEVYFAASKKILTGAYQQLYFDGENKLTHYYYPEFFALMFTPLYLIEQWGIGKLTWGIILYFSILYIVWESVSLQVNKKKSPSLFLKVIFISTLINLLGINDAFKNGNAGVLLIAFVMVSYRLFLNKKFIWSGLFVALAFCGKPYFLIILGYYVWAKSWQVVASSVLFGLLFLWGVPSILYQDATQGLTYLKFIVSLSEYCQSHTGCFPITSNSFQSFVASMARFFQHIGSSSYLGYQVGLISGVFLIVGAYLPTFFKRDVSDSQRQKYFFLAMACTYLMTPFAWYSMTLLLTPVLVFLVSQLLSTQSVLVITGFLVWLFTYCLTTTDIIGRPLNNIIEFYNVPFIGVLCVVALYLFQENSLKSTHSV